jgi:Pyrimidine dimer DNA glycosylase
MPDQFRRAGSPWASFCQNKDSSDMRLWSIHPSLLDQKGLVALWREALLAQKVLQGKTKGYKFHPQLVRFRAVRAPLTAISTYLWAVHDEATQRGYSFDASKIAGKRRALAMKVTQGQLDFELDHLKRKFRRRAPQRYRELRNSPRVAAHPIFKVVAGEIESWERVDAFSTRDGRT